MLKSYDDYEVTAGDILRGERATQGFDLYDVSMRIKLPIHTLQEIEDGIFTGDRPGYLINNIIRDYADFLGLDPTNIRYLYWQQVEKKLLEKEFGKPVSYGMPNSFFTTIKRLVARLAGR